MDKRTYLPLTKEVVIPAEAGIHPPTPRLRGASNPVPHSFSEGGWIPDQARDDGFVALWTQSRRPGGMTEGLTNTFNVFNVLVVCAEDKLGVIFY